jgi:L-ascorbate metabolism protein UlaG (beta-lactamase superfamily)
MDMQWLGTAGFAIRTGETTILIDPFLSRNEDSSPRFDLNTDDLTGIDYLFLSHGHFDHAFDAGYIAKKTHAKVFCSEKVAQRLSKEGVAQKSVTVLRSGNYFSSDDLTMNPLSSEHVRFDMGSVMGALARMGPSVLRQLWVLRYPQGEVFTFRFLIEDKSIQFYGSAGASEGELRRIAHLGKTDILLVPLQGNSSINDMALEYVRIIKPKIVVPHHYDDFYPPISKAQNITKFLSGVREVSPRTEVVTLNPGEWLSY